ncbi:polyketide cyclase [Cordyceps militaris]|uniref:Polyketide cyclase n=1 Tax=Cordyceps militaris TaxID=73501 RepID=A0A2H4SLW5_CORMI|nr:polyketide cyclase [Cordyceps militaris]
MELGHEHGYFVIDLMSKQSGSSRGRDQTHGHLIFTSSSTLHYICFLEFETLPASMKSLKDTHIIFSHWFSAIQNGYWNTAETFLASDVVVNGKSLTRHACIQKLQDDKFNTAQLDMCIVDDESAEIAARFLFPRPPDQTEAWTAQTLFTIVHDKLSTIQFLADRNYSAAPLSKTEPMGKKVAPAQGLNTSDLRAFYTDYIDSINTRTMRGHFDASCQDVVTHNHVDYTRDAYREMIESSFDDISGLRFTIERLVVNEEAQQVAARLGFTGVPIREFRGIAATGNAVRFSEHAFYQLERGQIRQVWSLLDLAAYRASMAS